MHELFPLQSSLVLFFQVSMTLNFISRPQTISLLSFNPIELRDFQFIRGILLNKAISHNIPF